MTVSRGPMSFCDAMAALHARNSKNKHGGTMLALTSAVGKSTPAGAHDPHSSAVGESSCVG